MNISILLDALQHDVNVITDPCVAMCLTYYSLPGLTYKGACVLKIFLYLALCFSEKKEVNLPCSHKFPLRK